MQIERLDDPPNLLSQTRAPTAHIPQHLHQIFCATMGQPAVCTIGLPTCAHKVAQPRNICQRKSRYNNRLRSRALCSRNSTQTQLCSQRPHFLMTRRRNAETQRIDTKKNLTRRSTSIWQPMNSILASSQTDTNNMSE